MAQDNEALLQEVARLRQLLALEQERRAAAEAAEVTARVRADAMERALAIVAAARTPADEAAERRRAADRARKASARPQNSAEFCGIPQTDAPLLPVPSPSPSVPSPPPPFIPPPPVTAAVPAPGQQPLLVVVPDAEPPPREPGWSALDLPPEPLADRRRRKAPPVTEDTPRLRRLTEALCAVFQARRGAKYAHLGAQDTQAVKRLMGFTEDDAEVLARWTRALEHPPGFNRADTIAKFASIWNAHAGAPQTGRVDIGRISHGEAGDPDAI